jgi:hypothetical protein
MFGTMILCGTILNQAAHDDKPLVVQGNKKKMYHIMLFRTKQTKCFFSICHVKYHMFLCFYVFGNAPLLTTINPNSTKASLTHLLPAVNQQIKFNNNNQHQLK